jgi:hypothetical protein
MAYRVEYKQSGTKWWRVVFAPVWLLIVIARAFGQAEVIIIDGHNPAHIDVPIHHPCHWDED